jgi:hypothetical protein
MRKGDSVPRVVCPSCHNKFAVTCQIVGRVTVCPYCPAAVKAVPHVRLIDYLRPSSEASRWSGWFFIALAAVLAVWPASEIMMSGGLPLAGDGVKGQAVRVALFGAATAAIVGIGYVGLAKDLRNRD